MAPTHFHVKFAVVQRSAGNDARKISAYQAAARVQRRDGAVYDFTRKRAEHTGGCVLLPEGAPTWAADPAVLWQAAEDAERRGDAQTARLVEIAIPREVPMELRLDLIRSVAAPWVADGMAAQVDLHCTRASDGRAQPHAHLLLTMRRFDGEKFAAKKERGWNVAFCANRGRTMRGEIAGRINVWCAAHGVAVRVDHRSHADQGVEGPAPERDVSRRAWAAHRADPSSPAAAPVRAVLAERQERRTARREAAWESARAAYAAEAAAAYAAERDRRQATRRAEAAEAQAARGGMRERQRDERDQAYRRTGRGIGRTVALSIQSARHESQRAALATAQGAARMGMAPGGGSVFPDFGAWLDTRATRGDPVAQAAVVQRAERRAALAQREPLAAARWELGDAERAAARVLRGRPRGSVDEAALFSAARDRLAMRRDAAVETARSARQGVWDHHRSASWWTRWTDAGWRSEHLRLSSVAAAARRQAERIARRYEGDVQVARQAAGQAAAAHRRQLVDWLARPEVRAAQAAQATAVEVRTAVDGGDEATIQAAATGDLPRAAQAARASAARTEAEAARAAEAQQAEIEAARRRAEQAQAEAARVAEARRRAAEVTRQVGAAAFASPSTAPGLRMR